MNKKGIYNGVYFLEICKRVKWVNGVGYVVVEGDL